MFGFTEASLALVCCAFGLLIWWLLPLTLLLLLLSKVETSYCCCCVAITVAAADIGGVGADVVACVVVAAAIEEVAPQNDVTVELAAAATAASEADGALPPQPIELAIALTFALPATTNPPLAGAAVAAADVVVVVVVPLPLPLLPVVCGEAAAIALAVAVVVVAGVPATSLSGDGAITLLQPTVVAPPATLVADSEFDDNELDDVVEEVGEFCCVVVVDVTVAAGAAVIVDIVEVAAKLVRFEATVRDSGITVVLPRTSLANGRLASGMPAVAGCCCCGESCKVALII